MRMDPSSMRWNRFVGLWFDWISIAIAIAIVNAIMEREKKERLLSDRLECKF